MWLRGTASASYGQGRGFESRFVPHRTILEKDTFTVSRCLPVVEYIKNVKNQVTRTEPVCLPIRHWYLLSVRAHYSVVLPITHVIFKSLLLGTAQLVYLLFLIFFRCLTRFRRVPEHLGFFRDLSLMARTIIHPVSQ